VKTYNEGFLGSLFQFFGTRLSNRKTKEKVYASVEDGPDHDRVDDRLHGFTEGAGKARHHATSSTPSAAAGDLLAAIPTTGQRLQLQLSDRDCPGATLSDDPRSGLVSVVSLQDHQEEGLHHAWDSQAINESSPKEVYLPAEGTIDHHGRRG